MRVARYTVASTALRVEPWVVTTQVLLPKRVVQAALEVGGDTGRAAPMA
jgi:hypothetical protein